MFESVETKPQLLQFKTWHFVVLGIIALGAGIVLYFDYRNFKYYEKSNSGMVRGNTKTRIFHIPRCPNYDEIYFKNSLEFQSIRAAEKAGFRAAANCPHEVIEHRRRFETE